MGVGYQVAYHLGITPWESAGEAGEGQLGALLDREESERKRPFGRAVDLGCGRGSFCIELARRGWDVTGVDNVAKAVDAARERAVAAGADATFVLADVTTLTADQVGRGVDFFLDVGCFHGLRDSQRAAMGRSVTGLAAPGATALLLAFRPGRRGPLPRGASQADIESAFGGWTVVDEVVAETSGMPGPLRNAAPRFYRLRRV
jgi:SAM-dependent methyltransferase